MLSSLTLKARILMLPLMAGMGFVLVFAVAIGLGGRAQRELRMIETGYSLSLKTSRELGDAPGALQRALRDAVGAGDAEAVTGSDSIAVSGTSAPACGQWPSAWNSYGRPA